MFSDNGGESSILTQIDYTDESSIVEYVESLLVGYRYTKVSHYIRRYIIKLYIKSDITES